MVDLTTIFDGVLAIVAPHMDDAVLTCGGTILKFPQKNKIHIIYATDGSRSPHSILPWYNGCSKDLPTIRRKEAEEALQMLGVPKENLHFFNFPDGKLKYCSSNFSKSFVNLIQKIKATHVLVPFRYDSHPDHLAVNRLTTKAIKKFSTDNIKIFEYFVYYNFRLLPGRDMRKYLNPNLLYRFDIQSESHKKRSALLCFKSQVTKFYNWQEHPVLSQAIIDDVCESHEVLLFEEKRQRPWGESNLFIKYHKYIPIIHFLEPVLKRIKDRNIEIIKLFLKFIRLMRLTN